MSNSKTMQHVDEHTLEQYTLGGKLGRTQAREIEAHLKECEGCRSHAKQISDFYERAEGILQQQADAEPARSAALVRQAQLPEVFTE